MPEQPRKAGVLSRLNDPGGLALWVSGLWILPFLFAAIWILPASVWVKLFAAGVAALLAPMPAMLYTRSQRRRLLSRAETSEDVAAQLKLQLETVRYRTSRLREELQAADRQARLSHQLTLLGQFTAGFMHEFNNPLAIVAGRIEVLLEERKVDSALCADLEQMLKETSYMSRIASTLLQALRRERGGEVFEASAPQTTLQDVLSAVQHACSSHGIRVVVELAEVPRVDVPDHVVGEIARGLLSNALEALKGQEDGMIWVRLEPYRTAGARVVAKTGPAFRRASEAIFSSHLSRKVRVASGWAWACSWRPACSICMMGEFDTKPETAEAQAS